MQMLNCFILSTSHRSDGFSPIFFLFASTGIIFMDPASGSLFLPYAMSNLLSERCSSPRRNSIHQGSLQSFHTVYKPMTQRVTRPHNREWHISYMCIHTCPYMEHNVSCASCFLFPSSPFLLFSWI